MIRQATIKDLEGIARVHAVCFPESYVTQLSKYKWLCGNLIPEFYREFMNDNPELFVVAEDGDHEIVGFCMGYYMDKDDQMSNFLHKNRIKVLIKSVLLLLIGNKHAWNKITARIKHKPSEEDWTIVNNKYEHITNAERGDLLSVYVLPDCRGKRYAQEMMELFLRQMKDAGRKLCLLSVRQDNSRAIKYYERNGFELYRTRGTEGYTFMKLL